MVKRYFTSVLSSNDDDPSPFERPPKRYFTSVVSSADDPSPFKTPPKQPKRYFTSVVSSNHYASSSESPFKRPPKQPTLPTKILHPNHATIFHQNSKRILHLNHPNILNRNQTNQTAVSDEDSSSESDDKIFKPRVKAAAEDENRNPNAKTSNNNEPAEPIPLIDSSLTAVGITADVKEYRESYVLEMDMAGLKSSEIKVEMEDENVLVISGERKREEGVKYLRMERRVGNLMRKFVLPENANTYSDAISAVFQDGLLSVTVQKKFPSPQPDMTRRTIEVVRIA